MDNQPQNPQAGNSDSLEPAITNATPSDPETIEPHDDDAYLSGGGGPIPGNKANYAKTVLDHRYKDSRDRRWMRSILFVICLGLAGYFLCLGLSITQDIVSGLLSYKKTVTDAVSAAIKARTGVTTAQELAGFIVPPESINHAKELAKTAKDTDISVIKGFLDSTNWLSASPLITLVAFVLGVGLTLMLGLIKVVFRSEAEAKEKEKEVEDDLRGVLATPVSKVLEELALKIKDFFAKLK
ncbi:hypothetical protein [Citrobacter tructae]|uniref:hypothetical protein n=1 Tax=Citrobacter tructae TaxID=2562449 RepID=UPI003F57C23D